VKERLGSVFVGWRAATRHVKVAAVAVLQQRRCSLFGLCAANARSLPLIPLAVGLSRISILKVVGRTSGKPKLNQARDL
jgi:hypothetical protein